LADKLLLAYHDRSDGGLLATLAEMAFAGRCGFDVSLDSLMAANKDLLAALFNEELGAVLQVKNDHVQGVRDHFGRAGIADHLHVLGTVCMDETLTFRGGTRVLYENTRPQLE